MLTYSEVARTRLASSRPSRLSRVSHALKAIGFMLKVLMLPGTGKAPAVARVLLMIALINGRAIAAESPALYVTDQFKTVARNILSKVVAEQIIRACPDHDKICQDMAVPLGQALRAAITSNDPKLKRSLGAFFVKSSIGGLTHALMRDTKESIGLREWESLESRFSQCIAAGLAGSRDGSCIMSVTDLKPLHSLVGGIDCAQPGLLYKEFCALERRALTHERIEPQSVVRVLADIAIWTGVDRPDLRVYLLGLERLIAFGLDDGVFEAALAFLADDKSMQDRVFALVNYSSANPTIRLWDPEEDSTWAAAISSCGFPIEPFSSWQKARDEAHWVEEARRAFLSGVPIKVEPMEALLRYSPNTCAKTDSAKVIRQLRKFTHYALAPLRLQETLSRYQLPALAAAALLDYVRTDDESEFQRNLLRTFLHGVAHSGHKKLILKGLELETRNPAVRITSSTLPTMTQAQQSCELRAGAALLGFTRTSETVQCYSFSQSIWIAAPALPPSVKGLPSRDWLIEHADELESTFAPLLVPEFPESFKYKIPDAETLKQVLSALKSGRWSAVSSSLTQPAIDFLVEQLEGLTKDWLGDDAGECLKQSQGTSIFFRRDGACTLHLLIQSAYRPIADYFWQSSGVGTGATPAQAVYDRLLASPAINRLPIILNVGLGANYIRGNSAVWGRHGYSALSVIDKAGVAFYKRTTSETEWEVGAFAGGFLDALARTATNEGESERFWLLGLTAGWTRLPHLPFGLEVHVAEAMPLRLNAKNRYGKTVGAAIVVPWSAFLRSGD